MLAAARNSAQRLHNLGSGELMIDLVKSFGIERPIIAVRPVSNCFERVQVPGGYHRTPPHRLARRVLTRGLAAAC